MKQDEINIPPVRKIHLIAIGNELLNGETRETNLSWLIKWLTRRGGTITRASVICDNSDDVGREINTALDYKADLIITTGGLGPTDDDSTMASVANCLGKPLEINEEALGYVKERIDALAKYRPGIPTGLTQERLSMAYCPVGGKPLRNPVGVAPGMEYKLENCILIVLPGVPNEMKGIIRETLQPFWSEFLKGICYVKRNIAVRGIPEAELAPFIRKLNREDPGVYVKSRLKVRGKQAIPERIVEPEKLRWHIILHFSLMEYSLKSGRERINRLIDILLDDLKTGYEYPYHVDLGN